MSGAHFRGEVRAAAAPHAHAPARPLPSYPYPRLRLLGGGLGSVGRHPCGDGSAWDPGDLMTFESPADI